jgi:hypothetical protein
MGRIAIACALVALAACERAPQAPGEAAAAQRGEPDGGPRRVEAPAPGAATATPSRPGAEPEAAAGLAEPKAATELVFRPPETRVAVALASDKQKARYVLPRAAGDDADAELFVFYFGKGGAGPAQANLARWAGFFQVEGGPPALESLKQSTRKVGAMEVIEGEIEGTYRGESSPGAGDQVVRPDWKLLGAIVQSPFGPYYLRVLGPRRTVEAHAAEVRDFISRLE